MAHRQMRSGSKSLALLLLLAATFVGGCGGAAGRGSTPAGGQTNLPQPQGGQATAPPAASGDLKPGSQAPEVMAENVFTGTRIKLSGLKGKPVLLNFWATWCGPCRLEMPDMERLHKELGDQIQILAVGADSTEAREDLRGFAKELGLTFAIAYDGGAGAKAYRLIGYPTSFFIDKDGIIREKIQGPMTYAFMKEMAAKIQTTGKP
jgi:thiol-disulfide isomerase/thioredoxin